MGHDLGPKRLEIFREMLPGLERVLFLYDATDPDLVAERKGYRAAAQRIDFRSPQESLSVPARLAPVASFFQKNAQVGCKSACGAE